MGHRVRRALFGIAAAAMCLAGLPAGRAGAATATANITGGSLAFVTPPPNVTFNATLNGTNQTVTASQALDVSDATGSNAGWSISATSTTFTTAGAVTLANNSTTVAATPTTACDSGSSCTVATNTVSYLYTLPAGASAPSATKMFNASANTGEGNETATVTWSLAVPSNATPGTYTSTWTISLASGP